MQVSDKGLALLKHFEGCRLTAYPDPRSPRVLQHNPKLSGDPWTIGYGCTGPGIHEGVVWAQAQADSQLLSRANAIASLIQGCVVPQLNQNQLDALVCLCYNIGQEAFRGSSLLRKLNTRDFKGAADEFLKWDHAHGVVVPDLLKRRQAERALFLQPA